jgi:hypothetical protein
MKDIPKKRIHIFIPDYIHAYVKEAAAKKRMTITALVTAAIFEYLMRPNYEEDTQEEV